MSENMAAMVSQSTLPGVPEGQAGYARLNRRSELVTAPIPFQWVQDGRVFQITNPAKQTALAMGGTSYSDTAPALVLDVASGTTMVPLYARFAQGGTVAGAVATLLITADTVARFTSGGTALTPRNLRSDGPVSTAVTSYYGTTATAITAAAVTTNWLLAGGLISPDVTPSVDVAFPGDFQNASMWVPVVAPHLVGPASLVVYLFAGTTQGSWFFNVTWAEIPSVSVK